MVLRNSRPVFESEPQLHGFNFPFQLTGPTPEDDSKTDIRKRDLPEDAKVSRARGGQSEWQKGRFSEHELRKPAKNHR